MSKDTILIIKTCKRHENVDSIQRVLTEFGCIIQTRLGLHEAGNACSDEGLIILQLVSDAEEIEKFEKALGSIKNVTYKSVQI